MGRVYTPQEIAAGHYPATLDAHTEVAARFIEGIAHEQATEPYYIDAMVYGSVAVGQHNRRSDVDVLALLPDDEQEGRAGQTVANLAASLAAEHHVYIEPNIASRRTAMAGAAPATVDGLFGDYLLRMAYHTPYITGNPAAYLPSMSHRWPDRDDQIRAAQAIAIKYIERKKSVALRVLASSDLPMPTLVQRAFEAPSAITRKLEAVARLADIRQNGYTEGRSQSREHLEQRACTMEPDDRNWHAAAAWLIGHNRAYSEVLEETIAGERSLTNYSNWLNDIAPEAARHMYNLAVAAGHQLCRQQVE